MNAVRNVLWISSYPKSGNTWVHNVLRLAGKEFGFPQVDLDVYNLAAKGIEPSVCGAVAGEFTSSPAVVLKTHAPFREDGQLHRLPGLVLHSAAYIHIYRNPLDVLLSYLNFSRIEYRAVGDNPVYRRKLFRELLGFSEDYGHDDWHALGLDGIPQSNLDHALDVFSESGMTIPTLEPMSGSWLDHTRSWLDASNAMPGTSVRYEDCLANSARIEGLSRYFTFPPGVVGTALEAVNALAKTPRAGSQDHSVFYNKMSAFYFDEYFSGAALGRFFSRHEQALIDVNYQDVVDHWRARGKRGG